MEMRKLQLDLFFTGSLGSFRSTLFSSIHFTSLTATSYQFSSVFFFFFWRVCMLVRRKRFLATLGKLFEFRSFILGFRFVFCHVVAGVHWFLVLCIFSLGFCGPWKCKAKEKRKKNLKIYSCLMLIRFGS